MKDYQLKFKQSNFLLFSLFGHRMQQQAVRLSYCGTTRSKLYGTWRQCATLSTHSVQDPLVSIISQSRYPNFIATAAKVRIVNFVYDETRALLDNDYLKTSGNATRLIHGEKGIGKTQALKDASDALCTVPAFRDRIVPIYHEYAGRAPVLIPPSHLIADGLGLLRGSLNIQGCIAALKLSNKYAFVIADEVDNLYSSLVNEYNRHVIIGELAELGTQDSGRIYTLLCGSASLLPILINKNAVHYPELVTEYPLVANAVHLNSSKYRSYRVSQEPNPVDFNKIVDGLGFQALYRDVTDSSQDIARISRFLYFFAGNNLRSMQTLLQELKSRKEDRVASVIKASFDDVGSQKSREHFGTLIERLRSILYDKNDAIINKVCDNPSWDTISKVDWFTELKGLVRSQVDDVVKQLNTENSKHNFSLTHVFHLVDKNWFSAPHDLSILYPSSPLDLARFALSNNTKPGVDKHLYKLIETPFSPERLAKVFLKGLGL